jgi:hypothetical protein
MFFYFQVPIQYLMEVSEIFFDLLKTPNAQRWYRELKNFYLKNNYVEEADAINYLLEEKFGKKNEKTSDDTSSTQE